MNRTIEGKNGISATLVSLSSKDTGEQIATVAVKYGLIVHAEFLRHRMLSRGVKSNRAIPAKVIRTEVLNDPYIPVFFGKNQAGMQSAQEVKYPWFAKQAWLVARYPACAIHWLLEMCGAHKEWVNRLLNPWQWVRETITATEWNNLYALRLDKAAQRDIKEVVWCVREAIETGQTEFLASGEWHTPFVTHYRDESDILHYIDNDGAELSIEQAKVCSAARCARSSYDKHDGGKAVFADDFKLFETLLKDDPKHASPVEHQATPMSNATNVFESEDWQHGTTHVDAQGQLWSGNFRGWIQHRQQIAGHVIPG
jgi:hypothetical protein